MNRRLDVLENRMKPSEILKDLNESVAIYPLKDKNRIDELLLLDKVYNLKKLTYVK